MAKEINPKEYNWKISNVFEKSAGGWYLSIGLETKARFCGKRRKPTTTTYIVIWVDSVEEVERDLTYGNELRFICNEGKFCNEFEFYNSLHHNNIILIIPSAAGQVFTNRRKQKYCPVFVT